MRPRKLACAIRLALLVALGSLWPTGSGAQRGPDGTDPTDADVLQSTGEATIRLEIELPKGTGGSEPELALVYSSMAPDGPFGIGWRLPLGEIRRTTRFGTPAHDDLTDRFEFEGELLIGAPAGAGAIPAEYRTATERFARIVPAVPTGTTTVTSWTVTFPDGRIARFGTDEGTRVRKDGTGAISRWLLSQLEDVNGNVTLFQYSADPDSAADPDPGTLYPVRIRYATAIKGDPWPWSAESSASSSSSTRRAPTPSTTTAVASRRGSRGAPRRFAPRWAGRPSAASS